MPGGADQERRPKLLAVTHADSDAVLRELVEHLPPRERAVSLRCT